MLWRVSSHGGRWFIVHDEPGPDVYRDKGTIVQPLYLRHPSPASATIARLKEALEDWKCPSCGGKKVYIHRSRDNGNEIVPCKVCAETGLHPRAAQALADLAGEG